MTTSYARPGVRVLGPEEGVDDKQFQREVGAALSADRMRPRGRTRES